MCVLICVCIMLFTLVVLGVDGWMVVAIAHARVYISIIYKEDRSPGTLVNHLPPSGVRTSPWPVPAPEWAARVTSAVTFRNFGSFLVDEPCVQNQIPRKYYKKIENPTTELQTIDFRMIFDIILASFFV